MWDKILAQAQKSAAAQKAKMIARLIAAAPPSVAARPVEEGVELRGRNLRWRFLQDAWLRNFWR